MMNPRDLDQAIYLDGKRINPADIEDLSVEEGWVEYNVWDEFEQRIKRVRKHGKIKLVNENGLGVVR